MAPRKLADSDKQEILSLYCSSDETTLSLAERFGVSTSTISRILKQSLSEEEYEALIQAKRAGIPKGGKSAAPASDAPSPGEQLSLPTPEKPILKPAKPVPAQVAAEDLSPAETSQDASAAGRSRRRRSSAPPDLNAANVLEELDELEKEIQQELRHAVYENLPDTLEPEPEVDSEPEEKRREPPRRRAPLVLEDLEDEDDDLDEDDELDDDLDDLDDLDDDLDEDDLGDDDGSYSPVHVQAGTVVQVLPLAEAMMPRTCYLVVDRAAELVTRPLSDFAELGQIPEVELQARTLPVFDNHRIAKRFMRRMQRIVKIPDGQMFFKTSAYLHAKGITRLLVDGQVYAIDGDDTAP